MEILFIAIWQDHLVLWLIYAKMVVVGSVLFYLDGVKIRNENKKPYAINGDKPTGYRSWNVSNGT
jgi:hypothetical protein